MGLKEAGLRGSLRSVSTAVSAIPESVVALFDARDAFDAEDDGTSVTEWPDEVGGFTATGGDATVVDDGINGQRALDFDGSDSYDVSSSDWQFDQPNTTIVVVESNFGSSPSDNAAIHDSLDSSNRQLLLYNNDDEWDAFAGESIRGSSDETQQLIAARFDGANGLLREGGSTTQTGDVGTGDWNGLRIGDSEGGGNFWIGKIGYLEVHDEALSESEISGREQEIAGGWGITI